MKVYTAPIPINRRSVATIIRQYIDACVKSGAYDQALQCHLCDSLLQLQDNFDWEKINNVHRDVRYAFHAACVNGHEQTVYVEISAGEAVHVMATAWEIDKIQHATLLQNLPPQERLPRSSVS